MSIFGTGTIWKWILAHVVPFLLPEAAAADEGKVVSVNSEGEYELDFPPSFNGGSVGRATEFQEDVQFNDIVSVNAPLVNIEDDPTPPVRNSYVTKQYVDSVDDYVVHLVLDSGSADDTLTLDEETLDIINEHLGNYFTVILGSDINTSIVIPIATHFDAVSSSAIHIYAANLTESAPTKYFDVSTTFDTHENMTSMVFTYKENLSHGVDLYLVRNFGQMIFLPKDTPGA